MPKKLSIGALSQQFPLRLIIGWAMRDHMRAELTIAALIMAIHGARAALPSLATAEGPLGNWLRGLSARAHRNTVVVALANKLARVAWAVLRSTAIYSARISDRPTAV